MNTLLLSWTPGPKGSWTAPHPFIQGAGEPAYRIVKHGPAWSAEYQGEAISNLMGSAEDAAWCASRHAFQYLRVSARRSVYAQKLLDAVATASLDALHRSPLGGRASA